MRIAKRGIFFVCGFALCFVLLPLALFGQDASRWWDTVKASQEAYAKGDSAKAEQLLKTALEQAERFGREDIRYGTTLRFLGEFYEGTKRPAEAEPYYQELLGILEKAVGPTDFMVTVPLRGLGRVKFARGKYGEAEPFFQRVLAIYDKLPEGDDNLVAVVADTLQEYAALLRRTGREEEATQLESRAESLWSKLAEWPEWVSRLLRVDDFRPEGMPADAVAKREGQAAPKDDDPVTRELRRQEQMSPEERMQQFEVITRRMVTTLETGPDAEGVELVELLNNLAVVCEAQEKYAEAELHYRHALAILDRSGMVANEGQAVILENYAGLLGKVGRETEASQLKTRAKAIRAKRAQQSTPR